jgi:hypothetical protein
MNPSAGDESPRAILNDKQFAVYAETREARRLADAENAAGNVLEDLGKSIDLEPLQKDQLFQALAEQELSSSGKLRWPTMQDDSRNEILQRYLTQEQMEIYNKGQEEERKRWTQLMQTLVQPASGEAAK